MSSKKPKGGCQGEDQIESKPEMANLDDLTRKLLKVPKAAVEDHSKGRSSKHGIKATEG